MKKSFYKRSLTLCILLIFLCLFLSSCGQTHVGGNITVNSTLTTTTPTTLVKSEKTTPSQGATNPSAQTIANGSSMGPGQDYAFVRNNQVWVALNAAAPVQATHFDVPTAASNALQWSQLHWFAQDRYLAFTVEVSARGGNSCLPLPIMGQLFVIDTSTMQTTAVTLQGIKTIQQIPIDGLWSTLTSQDDTHLLAWFGGGGIYRYDFTTQTVSLLIPTTSLPAIQGLQISSMVVRNSQLYYLGITQPDAAETSHFTIYSLPLSGGNTTSTKVFDAGSEVICSLKQQDGLIRQLGWDISPDGTHLVTLAIDNSNPSQPQGKVELADLRGGSTTPIFAQVPAEEGINDGRMRLSWSPDGHTILFQGTDTIYTSSIENPAITQTYDANYVGNVLWETSGTTFTTDDLHNRVVRIYTVGNPKGQVLLTNCVDFSGGNH